LPETAYVAKKFMASVFNQHNNNEIARLVDVDSVIAGNCNRQGIAFTQSSICTGIQHCNRGKTTNCFGNRHILGITEHALSVSRWHHVRDLCKFVAVGSLDTGRLLV
jgi:hypothetical protein